MTSKQRPKCKTTTKQCKRDKTPFHEDIIVFSKKTERRIVYQDLQSVDIQLEY